MFSKVFLIVIFNCLLFLQIVFGRSSGAPEEACDSMTPGHGYLFQSTLSPYTISVDTDCLTVIIQGTETFKGFLIKAFDNNNNTVGKFILNNLKTKITCEETGATHDEVLDIDQIGLRWNSNGFVGTVHFMATVVRNYSSFWRIASLPCDVHPSIDTNMTSLNQSQFTTSKPPVNQESLIVQVQQTCTQGSKCFQCPDNNCVITWSNGGEDYVDFQISGYVRSDNRYIAMSFSYDEQMGNDSVVLCWKKSDKYVTEVWYTGVHLIVKTPNPQESLKPNSTAGTYADNWMSCKFSKHIKRELNSSKDVYYLDESTYNLLFATGLMSDNGPLQHERRDYSTSKYNFTDFSLPPQAEVMFIDKCPVNAGCILCPDHKCVISFTPGDNDYVNFQISAPVTDENSYVAMGLSLDNFMGDDSITLCYKSGGSYVARMLASVGHSVQPAPNLLESLDPTSFSGTFTNGNLSCKFSKQIKRPVGSSDSVYYLNERSYIVLFATGQMAGETPRKHIYHSISSSEINLLDFSTKDVEGGARSNSLIKAHGILMVIAWLMIASSTILLPRYFKSAWPDTKIFKKPLWFIGHQTLMVFVFLITAISFIIIFCEVKGYVFDDSSATTRAHAPIGIIIIILVVMNPLMALVRCDTGHKYRWIFNFFHACVGQFVLVLAVVNIFLSFYMPQANIGYWVTWVMVALICWHVIIELLLILHEKYIQSKSSSLLSDTQDSGDFKIQHFISTSNSTSSGIKTFLLLCQWTGVTGLAIAICVGIGVA